MATQRDLPEAENPLLMKLGGFMPLSRDDRQAIVHASRKVRSVQAHCDIISDGERPNHVHLIIDGWAARYKILPNGERQITAYLIPGDFCDLHVTILREMDHGIVALTPVSVADISRHEMDTLCDDRPRLMRAMWWATLVDEGVLREWIVNIGRRDAYARIAHLMCEMHVRMRNVGRAEEGAFHLPLTQDHLADTLGLTPVHINRMLQRLRAEHLIELGGRTLTILDPVGLRSAAGFDASYLHNNEQNGR
ncbi:Crp/Fnr family transcriptional regulator [uncultured Sphingomonas sp.]|uniref:Crp/Fnr family transcriptional regulator n=1 Tax=uncultured Sphingomonas sp. TaxID=158754 RepID=UPI0025DEAFAD|nr:Crp/Fnr family transcriptional regulator [uncultured Sphingomonas sp.]